MKWSLWTGGAYRQVDFHIIPSPGIIKRWSLYTVGAYIQVELRAGSTVYIYIYTGISTLNKNMLFGSCQNECSSDGK